MKTTTLTRREVLLVYGMIFSHPNPNAFISSVFDTLIKKFTDFKIYPNDDGSQILGGASPDTMEFEFSEAEKIAIRKVLYHRLKGTREEPPIPYGIAKVTIWPLADTIGIGAKLKEEYEKTKNADMKNEGVDESQS